MRRCCGPKICSRRSRRRWSGARRASRTGSASAARLQPVDGVQGDAALAPDLEVQVRSLIARPTAHVAHDLSLDHALSLGHGGIVQIAVKAVEAAPVVDQYRSEVGAEQPREAHGAARDGAYGSAGRRRDSDPVPRDARIVRAGRGTELVHDPPLHGPVELAQVRRGDGGGGGGAASLGLAPRALERHDAVVQALLVALELGQALQRLARTAPRLPQRRLPLVLEGQVAVQFFGALVLAPSQHVARVDQRLPLPADAPLQLRHVVRQQAILPAHEIQVLVARQQVAEALRREQHLVRVQRPPFGDVDQTALQDGALLREGVLGEQQVDRGPVDLVRQRIDLAVQLVHDAIGRLLLSLDVRELVGERVHLGAQPLELLLDVGPLAADAFETLLVVAQLLIEGLRALSGKRDGGCGKREHDEDHDYASRIPHPASRSLHTRRRCLPTDAALPKSPISVPNPTIASAWTFEKNAAWMSQRLMSVYAAAD